MKIPYTELSEEVLRGVIEDFVLREGTDYGESEISLKEKTSQVKQLLKSGRAHVSFDEETSTCSIISAEQL